MFGHYNAWANNRRFAATAQLPTDQYRTDRGAFLRSVHVRLNDLVVTDRIWTQRFTGDATGWMRSCRPDRPEVTKTSLPGAQPCDQGVLCSAGAGRNNRA
jgi:uncharacterized damage-inducible protein DinB